MPHSGHRISVAADANRIEQRRQQRWVMINARSRRDGHGGMLDEGRSSQNFDRPLAADLEARRAASATKESEAVPLRAAKELAA